MAETGKSKLFPESTVRVDSSYKSRYDWRISPREYTEKYLINRIKNKQDAKRKNMTS